MMLCGLLIPQWRRSDWVFPLPLLPAPDNALCNVIKAWGKALKLHSLIALRSSEADFTSHQLWSRLCLRKYVMDILQIRGHHFVLLLSSLENQLLAFGKMSVITFLQWKILRNWIYWIWLIKKYYSETILIMIYSQKNYYLKFSLSSLQHQILRKIMLNH